MVTMPHWPLGLWKKNNNNTLQVMHKIMHLLGNQHLNLPPIIHIAGTNGKGSSVAFLKAIFEKAKYKVQTYTSPNLIFFNERIYANGDYISDDELYILAERVRIICDENNIQPSFFEATTAIAFLFFAQIKSDVLIIETGMGGRLDATNIIQSNIASIITPISMDHMEYLGANILAIANEKSGILKENSGGIVISYQEPEVYELLFQKCDLLSINPIGFGYDFGISKNENDDFCNYIDHKNLISLQNISLRGDHQLINTASCIAAIKQTKIDKLYNITDSHIIEGLSSAKWAGRIEKVNNKSITMLKNSTTNFWLDGAHNEAGALALSSWIKDNFKEPFFLILGMTKNRDVASFIKYFEDIVDKIFAVNIKSEPSSYRSEYLVKALQSNLLNVEDGNTLEDALEEIIALKPKHVIITGSLFLISDFYKLN